VVSKKSGLLYEKRLIQTHISDYGKCPVTGEPHTLVSLSHCLSDSSSLIIKSSSAVLWKIFDF
jgi:hypothetical protein